MNYKGQGIAINIVIIAAIAILVLVIVAVIVMKGGKNLDTNVKSCGSQGGTCRSAYDGCNLGEDQITSTTCPNTNEGISQICCVYSFK